MSSNAVEQIFESSLPCNSVLMLGLYLRHPRESTALWTFSGHEYHTTGKGRIPVARLIGIKVMRNEGSAAIAGVSAVVPTVFQAIFKGMNASSKALNTA